MGVCFLEKVCGQAVGLNRVGWNIKELLPTHSISHDRFAKNSFPQGTCLKQEVEEAVADGELGALSVWWRWVIWRRGFATPLHKSSECISPSSLKGFQTPSPYMDALHLRALSLLESPPL
jgi:hypothetical protein